MATDYSGTAAHKQRRRELLAAFTDGDPCPRCTRPMRHWQPLDADHIAQPHALHPHALPDALSHRSCNRYAGVVMREALQGVTMPSRPDQLEVVRQQVLALVTQRAHTHVDQGQRQATMTRTRTSRTR